MREFAGAKVLEQAKMKPGGTMVEIETLNEALMRYERPFSWEIAKNNQEDFRLREQESRESVA